MVSAAIAAACFALAAMADDNGRDDDSDGTLTIAVFGDWPYNDLLLANANLRKRSSSACRPTCGTRPRSWRAATGSMPTRRS